MEARYDVFESRQKQFFKRKIATRWRDIPNIFINFGAIIYTI